MNATTISLAIIGSGILSVIIAQISNHYRDIQMDKRQERKRLILFIIMLI